MIPNKSSSRDVFRIYKAEVENQLQNENNIIRSDHEVSITKNMMKVVNFGTVCMLLIRTCCSSIYNTEHTEVEWCS